MSSFGGIPLSLEDGAIDYLISCSNKCIQGVPGFAFIVAKKSSVIASEGNARTLALDLHQQWRGLEANGQFRFTPPTHAVLAFRKALDELEQETLQGRYQRYLNNTVVLAEGMKKLGFRRYLDPRIQGPIITTFYNPKCNNYNFKQFYQKLLDKGFVIYPNKVANIEGFRIGTIGHIFEDDIKRLLNAIAEVVSNMKINMVEQ